MVEHMKKALYDVKVEVTDHIGRVKKDVIEEVEKKIEIIDDKVERMSRLSMPLNRVDQTVDVDEAHKSTAD